MDMDITARLELVRVDFIKDVDLLEGIQDAGVK